MKLFIKNNLSVFSVYDEKGNEKYSIVFTKTHPVLKLKILNVQKQPVAKITRLPIPAIYTFSINDGKRNVKLVFNIIKNNVLCRFYGVNWHIIGNLCTKQFSIFDVDNTLVASQQKIFSKKHGSYQLDVFDEENELVCVAISVCIDLFNTVDSKVAQTV